MSSSLSICDQVLLLPWFVREQLHKQSDGLCNQSIHIQQEKTPSATRKMIVHTILFVTGFLNTHSYSVVMHKK